MKRLASFLLCLMFSVTTAYAEVADASQMAAVEDVVEDGMVPVHASELQEGVYPVRVDCSSSMFRITDCSLRVQDGKMSAVMTMSGSAYQWVYPGTAEEANSVEEGLIEAVENEDGQFSFTIPVEALDTGVRCAAWSRNRELWYDRTLCFRADSLPLSAFRALTTVETLGLEDGLYTANIRLSGGSGRARLESPARLTVQDGSCTVLLRWGSHSYDYMKVGSERYDPIPDEEASVFEIPIPAFDRALAVIADTVAMSEPHEIEYRLTVDSESIAPW